jgi:hypothetical protein
MSNNSTILVGISSKSKNFKGTVVLSFAKLGRCIGLSILAVTERVRRMEGVGINYGLSHRSPLKCNGWRLPIEHDDHFNCAVIRIKLVN